MVRGSTPTFDFKIKNVDVSAITDAWITISPYGKNGGTFTKKFDDLIIDFDKNIISVKYTEEETMEMGNIIDVQMKVLIGEDKVLVSRMMREPVSALLNWKPMIKKDEVEQPEDPDTGEDNNPAENPDDLPPAEDNEHDEDTV